MLAGAQPLLLVGAGKMGTAMLERWLANGLSPSDVTILDPYLEGDRWAELAGAGQFDRFARRLLVRRGHVGVNIESTQEPPG